MKKINSSGNPNTGASRNFGAKLLLFSFIFLFAGLQSAWAAVYIAGNGDEIAGEVWCCGKYWAANDGSGCLMTTVEDGVSYSYTATLPPDTYQFKVVDNGTWHGYDKLSTTYSTEGYSNQNGNIQFILPYTATVTVMYYTNENSIVLTSDATFIAQERQWQLVGECSFFSESWCANCSDDNLTRSADDDAVWEKLYTGVSLSAGYTASYKTLANNDYNIAQYPSSGNATFTGPSAAGTYNILFRLDTRNWSLTYNIYPITPTAASWNVSWAKPVIDESAQTVTLSATVAVADGQNFTLSQVEGLQAAIIIDGEADATRVDLKDANSYTLSRTIDYTTLTAGDNVGYSLKVVTGANSYVSGSDVTISSGSTFTVPEGSTTYTDLSITCDTTNGSYTTKPATLAGLTVGSTVTITTAPNTGYTASVVAGANCTVAQSDINENVWTVEITAANPTVTITFSAPCEVTADNFAISAQFNAGKGTLYAGTQITNGDADPNDGYFTDNNRTFTLSTSVSADSYAWSCTDYTVDGTAATTPAITWANENTASATATVDLPGTYTFTCTATCGTESYTSSVTITAPIPDMGVSADGCITDPNIGAWQHANAGSAGIMTRNGLTWTLSGFTFNNLSGEFVIIQQYKGQCENNEGWAGWTDGGCSEESNKINQSESTGNTQTNISGWPGNLKPSIPADESWTTSDTYDLIVTMTGWDTYNVVLQKHSEECSVPANFAITGQLNAGQDSPWKGPQAVSNGTATASDGVFADSYRTVTLSTALTADSYSWTCTSYIIDDTAPANAREVINGITWGTQDAATATAELPLPGEYTFQCAAACTGSAAVNSGTVTITVYPEIGFDGPIGTPSSVDQNGWNHTWAGTEGLMSRESGTLTWTKEFTYQGVNNSNEFVVIQRYKHACIGTTAEGWCGYQECNTTGFTNDLANKINTSTCTLTGIGWATGAVPNFVGSGSNWVSGTTNLKLTVTMTGWDTYELVLQEVVSEINMTVEVNDAALGTLSLSGPDGTVLATAGGSNDASATVKAVAYYGQTITFTATPIEGYKVGSWELGGTVYQLSGNTWSPTLGAQGYTVKVNFVPDCSTPIAYTVSVADDIICANGGSTTVSVLSQTGYTYELYAGDVLVSNSAKAGANDTNLNWTVSGITAETTYTVKAYETAKTACQSYATAMANSVTVKPISTFALTADPAATTALTQYQERTITSPYPVTWDVSCTATNCNIFGVTTTPTTYTANFGAVGDYTVTATMTNGNSNCSASTTFHHAGANNEVCVE